jgi:hypothetical protein
MVLIGPHHEVGLAKWRMLHYRGFFCSHLDQLFSVTSTEASLSPGIDQLYSTNSWLGALKGVTSDALLIKQKPKTNHICFSTKSKQTGFRFID